MRGHLAVRYVLLGFSVACGGGGKKKVEKPADDVEVKAPPKKETEEDREKKRLSQAHEIVPEGSSCLPAALKGENAPRLELGASGRDALICAIDEDKDRLLGPIACWKVNVTNGKLEYKNPAPLPGRGFMVKLDDKCARGYCLPEAPNADVVHMAWNIEGNKVAVLAGDQVHIFNAESKAHESSFSIRGEKGVTNEPRSLEFVSDAILIEGADQGANANVFVFKSDGTAVGPIMGLGGKPEKPVSVHHGSVSVLDKTRVALAEKGMEFLHTYDVTNGARAKLVRKVPKLACKPAELDAYWVDGDKVTDKCKDSIKKASGHLMGADVVAGGKSHLILLRGDRLGQLAIVDNKTLAEKSKLDMPWCGSEDAGGGGDKAADAEKTEEKAPAKKKSTTRGAVPADSSDPQEGGE